MTTVEDKRSVHRYKIFLQGIAGWESGHNLDLEVVDISTEGARLRAIKGFPIKEKDVLIILIKGKRKCKLKAEVKWCKEQERFIEFGVKFLNLDIRTREELVYLISDYALNDLL